MTVGVLLVVAVAAGWDLARNRIPNLLNALALAGALSLGVLASGWSGAANALAGVAVGGGIFIPLYLLGGMGAGDVKLMAAAGAFLGPSGALMAAVSSLIAGGALGLGLLAWRLVGRRSMVEQLLAGDAGSTGGFRATLHGARKERFPYAVAIATGVAVSVYLQGSLAGLYAALGIA